MAEPKTPAAAPGSIDVTALTKVYLFATLSQQELKFLTGVIKRREVRQGSAIFREGDAATSLFFVEKGNLRVVKTNPNGGDPIVLNTLNGGTLFGEIPFVAGGTRTASVVGVEFSTVWEITYDELERLSQLNPQFGLKLYKSLAGFLARSLRQTTLEMAGPKPEIKSSVRNRGGAPGTGGSNAGGASGPVPDAPNATISDSGEIVIEMDDDKK